MKDYLTEMEIAKIEQFCGDITMYEAVKKVLLAGIYTHGTIQKGVTPNPLQNAAYHLAAVSVENPVTNEIIGEHVRGMWYGVNALKNGFDELDRLKIKREELESPYNEAI
jgi:hypothetical protein